MSYCNDCKYLRRRANDRFADLDVGVTSQGGFYPLPNFKMGITQGIRHTPLRKADFISHLKGLKLSGYSREFMYLFLPSNENKTKLETGSSLLRRLRNSRRSFNHEIGDHYEDRLIASWVFRRLLEGKCRPRNISSGRL